MISRRYFLRRWSFIAGLALSLVAAAVLGEPVVLHKVDIPPPTLLSQVDSPPSPEPAGKLKLDLYEVLGVWRFKDDDKPFVIVQEDPEFEAYPNRLEAHTGNRVWKGRYTSFDEGEAARDQNARMVFRYQPKAVEMNPEVPLWARRAVEGKLEWRLELDEAGTEIDPELSVKWYRGRIRWEDGGGAGRTAEVSGDGVPQLFRLVPDYDIQIEDRDSIVLSISLGGAHDPATDPIEALIKGQRFFIKVTLPANVAEEQGNDLDVSIRGLTNDSATTMHLTSAGSVADRPVTYSHTEPVTIADCNIWSEPQREPQFLSLFWIFGVEGACLDVDADNGETVEFSFKGASQQVVIYNSWVQRGLVRQAQGAERLHALLESILLGNYNQAQKEEAHKRLAMLRNYDQLIASDKITDVHRINLGELYFGDTGLGLGLLMMTDEEIRDYWDHTWQRPVQTDGNYYNPLVKAYLEGLSGKKLDPTAPTAGDNIVWVSRYERDLVRRTLLETSQRLASNSISEAAQKFSFGLYDGYMGATGVGDLYLIYTGRDHFDHPMPQWMRLNAAIGLGSNAVLSVAGSRFAQSFLNVPVMRPVLGLGKRVRSTLFASAKRGIRKLDDLQLAPDLPRTLNHAQAESLALRLEEAPAGSGGPGCLSRAREIPQPRSLLDLEAPGQSLDLMQYYSVEEYVHRIYSTQTEFIDEFSGPIFEMQRPDLATCGMMSSNYAVWKKTGRRISIREGHQRLMNILQQEVQAGELHKTYLSLGPGVNVGYTQEAVRRYIRSLGARVGEISVKSNGRIKLRQIWAALEQGWSVKAIIQVRSHPRPAYHAVIVDGLEVTQDGRITRVRVYDPLVGQVIRVPATIFKSLLTKAARNAKYGVITVFRFDGK